LLSQNYVRGIPDYDHPSGLIRFDRSIRPISDGPDPNKVEAEEKEDVFEAFKGQGFSLKKPKK
jgi:ubiquitin fusion degradation protein 1